MGLFERVKKLIDDINIEILLEAYEDHWYLEEDTLTRGNKEGTYHYEVCGVSSNQDECLVIEVDTGMGFNVTMFLLLEKELTEEEFYKKF